MLEVFVAAALVFTPMGPDVQTGAFPTRAECVEKQAEIAQHPAVLAVSDCIVVKLDLPKSES